MMPAPHSASAPSSEKPNSMPSEPAKIVGMRNSGTPSGTVIAMAWVMLPVMTPRRALALLNANVTAARSAKNPPSTGNSRWRRYSRMTFVILL
jgi:hypothetical protein